MAIYTDITVLLDRSGSMASIKEAMETAFNSFIKEHQAIPTTKISLIQFDDTDPQEIVYLGVPVKYVEPLKIKPRGGTPLLDALCTAIDNTGKRYSNMDESVRPDQVLFIIITDGEENASRSHKRSDVSSRVTNQREKFNWNFIYLGANQDAFSESLSLGIPYTNVLKYSPDPFHIDNAWKGLVGSTVSYASNIGGMRGMSSSLAFDEQTRSRSATKTDLDVESTTTTGTA
jgi:uncharacterized protein YegL